MSDVQKVKIDDVPWDTLVQYLEQTDVALNKFKCNFPVHDAWFILVGQKARLVEEIYKRLASESTIC